MPRDRDAGATTLRALAVARVAIGALVLIRTTPLAALFANPLVVPPRGLLGWPDGTWAPTLGPALPASIIAALCIARTIGALLFALGAWSAVAGSLTAVAGALVMTQDAFAATHTFRLLYGAMFVLAVSDSAGALASRRVSIADLASSAALVRAWTTSVYAWAALAKCNAGWCSGLALTLAFRDGLLPSRVAAIVCATPTRAAVCATLVLAVEAVVALALGLGGPRVRRIGVAGALALHAGLEVVVRPDVFGLAMVALLLVVWSDAHGPAP